MQMPLVSEWKIGPTEEIKAFFLEANPLPGLNPESGDLVIMARQLGWTYEQLIHSILAAAFKRSSRHTISRDAGSWPDARTIPRTILGPTRYWPPAPGP